VLSKINSLTLQNRLHNRHSDNPKLILYLFFSTFVFLFHFCICFFHVCFGRPLLVISKNLYARLKFISQFLLDFDSKYRFMIRGSLFEPDVVLCSVPVIPYYSNTEDVLLTCLSSGWAITMCRLLGPMVGNSIRG